MTTDDRRNYTVIGWVSIAAIAAMFSLSGVAWLQAPGGGTALATVFAVPTLMAATLATVVVLARVEPRQSHVARSHKAFTAIWAAWLLFFVTVQSVLLLNHLGRSPSVGNYWPILAGLVTILTGNYLGKISSNGVAGFRTPWTLASELSWNKTHRLGGRLLFVLGLLLVAGPPFVSGDLWFYFILVASLLWTVALAIYSYLVWKADPDRSPARFSS
jgi:uncharacterized membrane protein